MTTSEVWKVKGEFSGTPTLEDFYIEKEDLASLQDNEILIEAVYLSLDPYIRLMPASGGLLGEQVARVVESKSSAFPVGSLVCAHVGWRTKTIVNVETPLSFGIKIQKVEELPDLSSSLYLGAAGMPGVTAYLSFNNKCEPKEGEILLVSSAAGTVGSVVGQLAKAKGLTVIGLAGSKEKCDFVKSLGFDHCFNYKEVNLKEAVGEVAPEGIDIYYDNVGGETFDTALNLLRFNGRVLLCGQISNYNKDKTALTRPDPNLTILFKQLTVRGFAVFSPGNMSLYEDARKELVSLLQQGKLQFKEYIADGFKNMPQAFIDLFTGANFGKAVVKA